MRPDGSVEVAATDLRFPNGSVITPDGSTLIVGQSFGGNYIAFTIADDATLTDRREWAAIVLRADPRRRYFGRGSLERLCGHVSFRKERRRSARVVPIEFR